jgi:flagellar basal-body rod protein FlgG
MTIRALSTASSGMIAQQTRVDVIANNLANVNTTGFKQDHANFKDLLYQVVQRAGMRMPGDNVTPVGKSIGSGVMLSSIDKHFTQGSLRQTGNDLDMAIEGEGFFMVQLPNGVTAYSRDGSFLKDREGNLVTGSGYFVEPQINLPEDADRFVVSPNGLIEAYNKAQQAPLAEFQLELARFANPKGLQAVGENLYLATEASGEAVVGAPGEESFGVIRQQMLEESNVEIVREMVELISAQRAYEINSNAIRAADEMMRTANSLRA